MANLKAKNWAMILAGGILLVWLIFAFMPATVSVEVAAIGRGDIVVTVQDDGKTRVKDLYVISAPITGRLLRIEKEVGDEVTGGKTALFTMLASPSAFLDSRSAESAKAGVRAAKAALELAESDQHRTEAEVEFAKSELSRIEPLFKSGTVSQAMLDRVSLQLLQAQSSLKSSHAAINVRRAELANAEAVLAPPVSNGKGDENSLLKIKSPVSGAVFALHHKSEGVVVAGTPILSVGNAAELEIVADFLSTSAVKVTKGASVIIEGWGGGRLMGRVRLVEPTGFLKVSALGIEEQRVNIIIDFDEPAEAFSKLGHGFRVEPKIVLDHKIGQTRVPISGLFRSNGGWAVFTEIDGKAHLTPVKIGAYNVDYATVIEGLNVGDTIILHPSDQVEDGVSIKAEE